MIMWLKNNECADYFKSMNNQKIVICNGADQDDPTGLSSYLLCEHAKEVFTGLRRFSEQKGAQVILYLDQKQDISQIENYVSPTMHLVVGESSPVLRNATALVNALLGNLPQPFYKAEVEALKLGNCEISQICTPEEAYYEGSQNFTETWLEVKKDLTHEFMKVPKGTKIKDILITMGTLETQAILYGGILGQFYNHDKIDDSLVVGNGLQQEVIQILDSKACMVHEAKKVLEKSYLKSCGKCVVCREGTYQFKTILGDISEGKGKMNDLELLEDLTSLIPQGAFCEFGENMIGPVSSVLSQFRSEFEDHIRRKRCQTSTCKAFSNYVILPNLCTGCGDCKDECPEDAIEGKTGFIYMIDGDLCEKCGKCVKVCEEKAIILDGTSTIKLPKKLTKVGKF